MPSRRKRLDCSRVFMSESSIAVQPDFQRRSIVCAGADISKKKFRESQITLDIRPVDNMNAVAKVRIRVLDKNGNEIYLSQLNAGAKQTVMQVLLKVLYNLGDYEPPVMIDTVMGVLDKESREDVRQLITAITIYIYQERRNSNGSQKGHE